MSKPVHPVALFRLTVLGQMISRNKLCRGEIKKLAAQLAAETYSIPNSRRIHVSEQAILSWYYAWKRHGFDGLIPKLRADKGKTQLSKVIQDALVLHKKDNPARSINTLIKLLEKQGLVAKNELSRATVHRFLQQQDLSKRIIADKHTIERRSFVAEHAGDMWQGDALHGPGIQTSSGMKKTYLVSLMDDASRLIVHSAFCFGETALDIEGVLKQAILKRGLPYKLIIDNGPAYRAGSLQGICAMLDIRLVYCRPYEPEGKGKLERFHRTFREQFLNEIKIEKITDLDDLNARLWAWLDQVYHAQPHAGLHDNQTPLDRWRNDLVHVRPLGFKAERIDDIFCHRVERTVHKDGTVSWNGEQFEVEFNLVDKKLILVVDPHTQTVVRAESVFGDNLGAATRLDKLANLNRRRHRPKQAPVPMLKQGDDVVELAYQEYQKLFNIPSSKSSDHHTEEK